MDTYGLYSTVFGIPPALSGKTTGTPRPESSAIHAAIILCGLLSSVTGIPAPHEELVKQAREDHNLRQRLIFGAALTPWKNMTYTEKKRSPPLVEGIIREGLKAGHVQRRF